MKILFLCVANSARSQIAEGLARAVFQNRVEVYSAGSNPSGVVHHVATQVMKEIGIDISKQFSKNWNQLPPQFLSELDFVITLCEEECPNLITHAMKLSWGIQDPAAVAGGEAEILGAFRKVRDKIRTQIEHFGRTHSLL